MLWCMKSRVLVVDDDPALAEMLTIVLRGEGFDTAVVSDGTRALPAVRELRPDVVLLDLMLPGMNGIDVFRAIRSESGVPIVMLTAQTDTADTRLGNVHVQRLRSKVERDPEHPEVVLTVRGVGYKAGPP